MKSTATVLAILLGLSTPAVVDTYTAAAIAMPTDFDYPAGAFKDIRTDNTWLIRLYLNEFGAYTYEGQNLRTGDFLTLNNVQVSGTSQRNTYTFNNGGYRYTIAHQPADPEYIRLTVMDPSGNELLNELMVRVGNDWDL